MGEQSSVVSRSREGGAVVVHVNTNRVNEFTHIRELNTVARDAINNEEFDTLVIDLVPVEYVISELFASLIAMKKEMDRDGKRFAVCCGSPYIRDLFEVNRLDTVMNVGTNLQDLLKVASN